MRCWFVRDTRLFLEGRNDELLADLRARMTSAAGEERFEEAAEVRDATRTIEALRGRQQKMAMPTLGDRDAFGLHLGPSGAVVEIFQVRAGRVVDRVELVTEGVGIDARTASEVLRAALQQFYEDRPPPPEVHLPLAAGDAETETLESWLASRAGRRVRLSVPRRGEKRGLLELAARNASVAYQARFSEGIAAHYEALEGKFMPLHRLWSNCACRDRRS